MRRFGALTAVYPAASSKSPSDPSEPGAPGHVGPTPRNEPLLDGQRAGERRSPDGGVHRFDYPALEVALGISIASVRVRLIRALVRQVFKLFFLSGFGIYFRGFEGFWLYFQILWRFLRRFRYFSSPNTPWGPILGQNKISKS